MKMHDFLKEITAVTFKVESIGIKLKNIIETCRDKNPHQLSRLQKPRTLFRLDRKM
jgi:hypothetical protein